MKFYFFKLKKNNLFEKCTDHVQTIYVTFSCWHGVVWFPKTFFIFPGKYRNCIWRNATIFFYIRFQCFRISISFYSSFSVANIRLSIFTSEWKVIFYMAWKQTEIEAISVFPSHKRMSSFAPFLHEHSTA